MREFALIAVLALSSLHPFKAKTCLVNLLQITLRMQWGYICRTFTSGSFSWLVCFHFQTRYSVPLLQSHDSLHYSPRRCSNPPSIPPPLHSVSNKHRTTHYSTLELIPPPIGSSSRILPPESPPAPPSSPPPARARSPSPRTAPGRCRSTADTSVPPRFCPAPWSPRSA